jgi:hypothetical protein
VEKNLPEPESFQKIEERNTTTVMDTMATMSTDMDMNIGTTTSMTMSMNISIIMATATVITKEENKKSRERFHPEMLPFLKILRMIVKK